MKQKLTAALLALVCLAALCGCKGAADVGPTGYTLEALELIAEEGAFSEELESLDADTAFMLYHLGDYGLERDALTGCAVLRSAGATCEEGAVLIWQTEEQAVQAQQAMENYIQSQIDANKDYRPAEIPKLENAEISQVENTILMVVADDINAVQKAVPDLETAER